MGLILFFIVLTIYLKPYEIFPRDVKNLPEAVFKNFILMEIRKDGIKSTLKGKIGKKFKNKLVVENLEYNNISNKKETIRAKRGIYKDNIIKLFKNIVYKTENFTFYTEMAEYNLKKKILFSKTKFRLITKNSLIIGDNLIYYRNKGKILAKNIDANIKVKKKK